MCSTVPSALTQTSYSSMRKMYSTSARIQEGKTNVPSRTPDSKPTATTYIAAGTFTLIPTSEFMGVAGEWMLLSS